MTKREGEKKQYRVRVDCHNNTNGKAFKAGDLCKDGDFPPAVIANFLAKGVLEVFDGSDA